MWCNTVTCVAEHCLSAREKSPMQLSTLSAHVQLWSMCVLILCSCKICQVCMCLVCTFVSNVLQLTLECISFYQCGFICRLEPSQLSLSPGLLTQLCGCQMTRLLTVASASSGSLLSEERYTVQSLSAHVPISQTYLYATKFPFFLFLCLT